MDKAIKTTQRTFALLVVGIIVIVIGTLWGMLQWYSSTEISKPSTSSEIHNSSSQNAALSEYINQEKEYEAHFISLATEIKKAEAERLSTALGLTSVIALAVGILMAVVITKKLIEPVREANASQERFIQDAAHELRNPLAAMTIALQQADKKTIATPLYRTIQRQTKRLVGINEDLLFLEKRTAVDIRLIALDDLLYDVVEELQPLSAVKKLNISVRSDSSIVKRMDARDYARLVKNVIENAVKYSKDGGKISIEQKADRKRIFIIVSDQGIGIPSKELQLISKRFYRASNTGKIEGTGLGLAIVKKILNSYGGKLVVTSTEKKGTTVTIDLPA